MEMNEVLDRLPRHLLDLVIDQPYNEYTAQDHALWRYVMRQNVRFLGKMAHGSYTDGLRQTGISIDRIPHMYGMNRILKEIGWAAVAVDGFIPPAAFMEFQAYKVLVIAADIRPIGQIEYTPAPDIIHEAAGHAPIIADPEYAEYLRLFGEIGSKAFSSAANYRLYEAIRHLSILKTDPYTPKDKIIDAEKKLSEKEKELGELSEMSLIRNLHWWTVEYGLIGELKNPKIYGAGLLSSIGESQHAMGDKVKKIPYDIHAKDFAFDITNMQPQLFVTPDFPHLTAVLREFEKSMALKRGGLYGINQAIASESDATCVYSSGLEVSGIFTKVIEENGQPVYLQTNGPSTLNFKNKQLRGHGKEQHPHGYGSPIGMIKGVSVPPEKLTESKLSEHGIEKGKACKIEFESGICLEGVLFSSVVEKNNLLLLSFSECTVRYRDQLLFEPGWGVYDMAIGAEIVSCFSGPSDPDAYGLRFPVPHEKTHKIIHDEDSLKLFRMYQEVRDVREANSADTDFDCIIETLITDYPDDWLLTIEVLEFARKTGNVELKNMAGSYLTEIIKNYPEYTRLIEQGKDL
ncbi:MAG: aromatic amino acid hydroxylase [Bacteroidetes bacterium]|nr:MAG: aromatic amino acid hydroxylase [Bacteroidota bacterium]